MTSTRAGLLQTILANPDDDDSRLIFADFLEDQGEARYAQFIRTQVKLARVPEYDPFWLQCRFQDWEMIFGHSFEKERPPLPPGIRWDSRSFERGLPARIEVDQVETFVARAPALFELAPIQSLKVHSAYRQPPPNIAALCDSPYLSRLRELTFCLSRLPAAEVQQLQDSPYAANLATLQFEFAGLAPDALAALFRPPLINQLTRLGLRSNSLGWPNLANAIQGAGGPGRLRNLILSETSRCFCTRPDLFGTPLLRGLVEIDLLLNELGPVGTRTLAESLIAGSLESLNLTRTYPGVPGVQALAQCPAFSGLRRLDLGRNRLGPLAVKHLAHSPYLGNLRVLNLSDNPLGDKGAQALAESPSLQNLKHLELTGCEIGDVGVQALLNSPITGGLVRLVVSGHFKKGQISDAVKQKVQEQFHGRTFI